MSDYYDILDYNEDLDDSGDEKDSRESLLKSRLFVSNDEMNDRVDDDSRRSRSPIKSPCFDSRESTESRESTLEPIENVSPPKSRYIKFCLSF